MTSSQQSAVSSQQSAVSSQQSAVSSQQLRCSVVLFLIGVLLLTTGMLKLFAPTANFTSDLGPWFSPQLRKIAIGWELLLGLFLISRRVPALGWIAALATFLMFAGISLYFVMIGKSYCGCLGLVETTPYLILLLDTFVILMLTVSRPSFTFNGTRRLVIQIGSISLGTAAILSVVSTAAWIRYGSIKSAITAITGKAIDSDMIVDFGQASSGAQVERIISVNNNSNRVIRLIGGTADCSCVTTSDLPADVPGHGSVLIGIRLSVPESASGVITRHAYLLTDRETQRSVRIRLVCDVVNHG